MRSRGRVRRHRPGRGGTGGPRAEGPGDRRFRSARRRHARGVRHRVPVAPGARRRRLRAQVPAGDLGGAAPARQAAGRGRAEDRLRRRRPRLHGQGQRPGALRADLQGPGAAPPGDRPLARVGHHSPARTRSSTRPSTTSPSPRPPRRSTAATATSGTSRTRAAPWKTRPMPRPTRSGC